MSKGKEKIIKCKKEEFYLELCFKEWCRDNLSEATIADVEDIQKEYLLDLESSDLYLYVCSMNNVSYKSSSRW